MEGVSTTQRTDRDARVMLGLLRALDADGTRSQRDLAADLGVALGLVNAYLKRCTKKGLVKVRAVPPRRYAYYLTPDGFAEKARLTARYLAYSFAFLRRARTECAEMFDRAIAERRHRFLLMGAGELAEIAVLAALGRDVAILAVVDSALAGQRVAGVRVVTDIAAAGVEADAILVTDIARPQYAWDAAVAAFGRERVFVPPLLGASDRAAVSPAG